MYEELVTALRQIQDWNAMDFDDETGYAKEIIGEAADAIEELSAKVDSLQFFADNISKLPDCNTCLKKNLCEFMPRYGEYCRINCPAWLGEPEPPKEGKDINVLGKKEADG